MDTSSSSSSDEELDRIMELLPEIRQVRPRRDPFILYNNREFKARYRFCKETVNQLLQIIREDLIQTQKNNEVTPMNQLLITLRYYATGSFQQVLGDHINVHKSTVGRIVHRVGHYIASLSDRFIRMPSTNEEIAVVKQQFYNIARFPAVVGAIDCSHIKILSPGGENAEVFRNRKGWFSINVQVIGDMKLKIRDIVASYPGSVHDSTIYNDSLIRARFLNGEFSNSYLIGDGGYMCTNHLMTPLGNPQTQSQNNYQNAHINTRNVIERLFGVWKRRFPVLSVGMQIKVENVLRVIVSAAVLHNLAIENDDIFEIDRDQHIENQIEVEHQDAELERSGNALRTHLINTFF